MRVNIKISLTFLLVILGSFLLVGQEETDSTQFQIRGFDDGALDLYKSQRVFNYSKDPDFESNFLQRFWNYILEQLYGLLGEKNTGQLFKWILVILALTGLVFFIRSAQKGVWTSPLEATDTVEDNWHEVNENTNQERLEKLLQQAINADAYRMAVRLHFLILLKQLNDVEIIRIQEHKTNQDYSLEIDDLYLRADFGQASQIFEYVWYGEVPIQQSEFQDIRIQFDALLAKINPQYV